ncbi:cell wall-binding repeat-containing protein [Desulfosporosinus sp. BICA1-9]|uniref:cell wall-binding repeat-containing protein n=1 Tax=Desulfosporosinus sp. BICA1-9 TaxID=1531958 RepID=UPI000ABD1DA9|nr:cell wall-binding repeat-containing protein [Desulfosporosinus sp. BICA1-9]
MTLIIERVTLLKKFFFSIMASLTVVLCTPFITYASPLAYQTERLAGQDRVETALKISQKGWQSAQTIILCEYNDYPDSIAATPFAVSLNAPILLTKGDSIDPRVVQELQRLKPEKVILLGGTACLQPSIEKELENSGLKWERIGGLDRYETSIMLAKKLANDSLILVNGDDFPDALSAATYAGIQQVPIVLTSTTFPNSVIEYLKETVAKHLIVIGGEVVVPSEQLTKHNFMIETRLGGLDRYDTNAKVISFMKDTYQSTDLFMASGITFPDAVAGTVLAAKFKAPLLLTEHMDIPPSVYTIMREHMKIEPPAKDPNPDSDSNTDSKEGLLKGKITASGVLNLRETPSSTGKILAMIPEGTTVELTEKQDKWYKTTYQSKTGWIAADYVSITSTGIVNATGGLNLRETPSPTGKVLLNIPKDTTIALTDQQGQWYKTTYQAKTGWVSADYVTLASTSIVSSTPKTISTTTSTTTSTTASPTTPPFNFTVNGTVYILGGTGIISLNTQNIIEGKASSSYQSNLRDFPPLPSELAKPDPPPATDDEVTDYDPSKEVLVNPFQGIPANALSGKTIFLDPGHGGPDLGAKGPTQTYEKNNTLAIGLALNDILKQAGAKVILTRTTDVSPATKYSQLEDLQARMVLANSCNADLFISIHNDSFTIPTIQGTTTFYSRDNPRQNESLQLASSVQTALIDTLKTTDRGVKEAGFYVLKHTTMPSILIETAFISNPYEEARLQNPTFRKNVSAAIFRGTYNYYTNPLPRD